MAKGPYGESQWGQNYTDNSVYQDKKEQSRQRAVVATFLSQTPEYYRCPFNDQRLVDFIEDSKRPFTIETLNWAYKECLYFLETKNESPFNKILKSLSNLGDSDSSDMAAKDLEIEQEKLQAFLKKKKEQKAVLEEQAAVNKTKLELIKEAYSMTSLPPVSPQQTVTPEASDTIVVTPMSTVRRIKHDE